MSAEAVVPSDAGGNGPAVLSSNALPLGTRIHEFEITRVIGEGGFSVVYLAFDHTLHRSIALKEYIPSALASRRGDYTVAVRSAQHQQTFEAGLRSFINEARLLAQFDHPSLVKVYRFWEANGTAYMAMPYYDGRTLKQILREHPEQATQAWLCELLVPLLDALELLHRHRCYHRDIAPDNIQILENGAPVLLDFGAARRTIGDMTQAFTVILKPGYAPIEQYADEADLKQGPWTDVYALAAVLYGAIVRKPPPTAVARVIKDPLEPLASRGLTGFSQGFLAAIDRGLGVRPEARPQSIAQWRVQLGVQPAAHRGADATFHDVASAPGGAASTAPSAPPAAMPVQAERNADTAAAPSGSTDTVDEAFVNEGDRTVLVPGLRRPPADAPRVQAHGERQSAAPPWRALAPRPAVLVAIAVAIVAVVAFAVIERTRAPSPAVVSQASAPGAAIDARTTPASPVQEAATKTPPAPMAGKAEKPELPQAPANPSVAPSPNSPPASVARTESVPASPAAEHPSSEPVATKASPNAGQGNEPARPAKVPAAEAPPRVASVAEDERRWATIRNSSNVADFLAFQLQYPKSPHARTAAARVKALERAQEPEKSAPSRPATSAATASSSSPSAPAASASAPPVSATVPPVSSSVPSVSSAPSVPASASSVSASAPATSAPVQAAVASPANAVSVTPSAASPPAGQALVRVRVRPFGYVYVDGALIGPSPPVREVPLAPGRHRIEARNSDARPPTVATDVSLDGGAARDVELRFGR